MFVAAVMFALVASLLFGLLLPLYTDEVGWRFQERAAIDGVDKMFSDGCGPNTLAAPPLFMMPVRYFSAWTNLAFANPLFVRLSGVGYALVLVTLLWRLVRATTRDGDERSLVRLIMFGLLGLGMLPLLMVWSRPEQPILLCLTGALLVAARAWSEAEPASRRTVALRWLAIVALAVVALSYHLKGVLLAPVFALCLLTSGTGRATAAMRWAGAVLLTIVALVAARYWVARFACPGDPMLASIYAQHNISAALVNGRGISDIAGKLLTNADLLRYFLMAAPTDQPMSDWVVGRAASPASVEIWRSAVLLLWGVTLLLTVACLVAEAIDAVRRKVIQPKLLLAAALLVLAIVWSATQSVKNVYDASFVLPLLILSAMLAIPAAALSSERLRLLSPVATLCGVAAIASALLIVPMYLPFFRQTAAATAYLPDQPFSIATFGYREAEPQIRRAAALCGIGRHGRPRGLMVDDLTYFAFMDSDRPQHRLGVLGGWRGQIVDPLAYLRSVGSDGAILGCRFLDPALRARAKSVGEFCCLDPKAP